MHTFSTTFYSESVIWKSLINQLVNLFKSCINLLSNAHICFKGKVLQSEECLQCSNDYYFDQGLYCTVFCTAFCTVLLYSITVLYSNTVQ